MGQVFVRGWQLRAAVILLILLSLGLLPGAAKAWTSSNTLSSANPSITFTAPNCGSLITGGNPDSTFCTGVPNFGCGMVDPTAVPPCLPGGVTCDLALTNPCPVDTSPTTCPLQSADQINEVCQHFALNVAALGTVSACIVFPHGTVPMDPSAENVVDIFVVQLNAMGQAVAVKADTSISTSSSPGPTPGTLQVCASFDSPAGATAFDVQLNPTFLVGPIGTGQITGTLTFTPAMQLRAQEFEHGDDEFRGNGETESGGKFEEGAHRHQDGSSEGRTHYKNDQEHCSFKSTQITLIQITPTAIDPTTGRQLGVLHMEGQGLNYGQPVTFVLDSVDNGDSGMLSTYSLTTSDGCHGGGHVTKGHAKYHHDD